jgi:hypothetical protein
LAITDRPADESDEELQRAIKVSLNEAPQYFGPQEPSAEVTTTNWDHPGEEEQMARAMEESMYMSLKREGAQENAARGWDENQAPQSRVRQHMKACVHLFLSPPPFSDSAIISVLSPVALRTSSPAFSYLAVFLQGLYAAIPFRRAVLALEPIPEEYQSPSYSGYWKGQPEWSLASAYDSSDAVKIILGLQRLFTFMSSTRRKWINIEEMVQIFGLDAADLSYARDPVFPSNSKAHFSITLH